jgi:5,5'-dehydrodivanillate O-demethylase
VTDPQTGRMITSHIMNQDFVAWIGQGAIADRENEHLGASDRGVVMMRRRLLSDIEVVAAGGEPKAIVRDPVQNQCIRLPIINRRLLVEGVTSTERDALERKRRDSSAAYNDGFVYLAGQPEQIRKAFEEAMGKRD